MRCVLATCLIMQLTTTLVSAIDIDCSILANQDAPKCKPRTTAVKLPESDEFVNSLKQLVTAMDALGGEPGSAAHADFEAKIADTRARMAFVVAFMQSRQEEIDGTVHEISTQTAIFVDGFYSKVRELRADAAQLVQYVNKISGGDPVKALLAQQKVVETIEKLQVMRNNIETSFLESTDRPTFSLVQQAQKLSYLLNHAVVGHHSSEDDDSRPTSFLQTETQTGLAADQAIRILDEVIENYRSLRSMIRDSASRDRDSLDHELEAVQKNLEGAISGVHFYNDQASESITNIQKLRAYVSVLTASQYGALKWYETVQSNIRLLADLSDSSARLVDAATPLFDELLHYLHDGNTPFTRLRESSNPCQGRVDACGVCGGNNETCTSCDGVVRGLSTVDVCGNCVEGSFSGAKCSYFCDHRPNSGLIPDLCGTCFQDDQICLGCDNTLNSNLVFDRCGVCGGDGTSCTVTAACASVTCPNQQPSCPPMMKISSAGYRGCCFDPSADCVARSS